MAVKAKVSITISHLIDISSITRYYFLQSSTSAAPAKPTTNPPSESWVKTEPSYTSGSTNTLYFVDCTEFTNDTFKYSEVSKSSSYEAAKEAYNKATTVETRVTAAETAITQNKTDITLRATKTEVKTAINNIEIGGRNLLVGTSASRTITGLGGSNECTDLYGLSDYYFSLPSRDGKQFTMSFEWETSVDWETNPANGRIFMQTNSTPWERLAMPIFPSSTNSSGKVVYTFTASGFDTGKWTAVQLRLDKLIGDVTIKNMMLEMGSKASSWQPAPEDLQDDIREQNDDIISACNENIANALDDYVRTGDYEEYKKTVTTSLELMADQIQMNFETTSTSLTSVDDEMQTRFNELTKYIRFSIDGIEIGGSKDLLTLRLDDDLIRFEKSGETLGWWDGVDFHTGNIQIDVTERAQFGNFAFVPRSDGSLMFLKVDNVVGVAYCPDLTDADVGNALQYEALPGHGIRVYTTEGQSSTVNLSDVTYDYTKKYRITYTSKNAKITCLGYSEDATSLPTLCTNTTDGVNTIIVDGLYEFQFENVDTSITEYSIKDMRIVEVN